MRRLAQALAALAAVVAIVVLGVPPARAARPLLDSGKWDTYFALFARDAAVPWKRISVRLDTFSGAPVEFAAYDVDPADVLVAGANSRPRALDSARRTPVARWRFTPPSGLRLTSSDVEVPLKDREGFYVIEARRGDAVQQVWLNVSRTGLVTKEAAGGALLYGADLATGKALPGMRITYLVGTAFTYDKTDGNGISHVPARARFALAEWGRGKSFVSFLPQSPPANAVAGVRADRAAVRAGETVRVIGFARKRAGDDYRPASGEATVSIVAGAAILVGTRVPIDRAGAFTAELTIPAGSPAGTAAILASAGGANAGATLYIDAVGDVTLAVSGPCSAACPGDAPLALTVSARAGNAPAAGREVRVRIVRTPHIRPPGTADDAVAWGTTQIADTTVRTGAGGTAVVTIPAPTDGLSSTYGIAASAGASTASLRLVAPTARVALAVTPERLLLDTGDPIEVRVQAYDAVDGSPVAGAKVRVRLMHGSDVQENGVVLDAEGNGRASFREATPGTSLILADTEAEGTALDVAAVSVAPRAMGGGRARATGDLHISLEGARHKPGDRMTIVAALAGAAGDALVTIESAHGAVATVVPIRGGSATATLTVPETLGAVSVGAVMVREGVMVDAVLPVSIDRPGHERLLTLSPDRPAYEPGATATIAIGDAGDRTAATFAVRLTDRRPAGGASFDGVAGVLVSSGTTTQNLASEDPPWHAWVAPARSTAGDLFAFDRPPAAGRVDENLAPESSRVLAWRVERGDRETLDVVLPRQRGRYVISVVKIADDGDVGSASLAVTVQ